MICKGEGISRWKEVIMDKERLEWVISGLNQHALAKTEDQFVKTASENFEKKHALTEIQEERLGSLYKEKSKLIPNKNSSNYFSFKEDEIVKSHIPYVVHASTSLS